MSDADVVGVVNAAAALFSRAPNQTEAKDPLSQINREHIPPHASAHELLRTGGVAYIKQLGAQEDEWCDRLGISISEDSDNFEIFHDLIWNGLLT